MDLLTNTFDAQAVQEISNLPLLPQDQQDVLRWMPAKNGICTLVRLADKPWLKVLLADLL
jgi:hypothetical protein